jgi:hypothetical protein
LREGLDTDLLIWPPSPITPSLIARGVGHLLIDFTSCREVRCVWPQPSVEGRHSIRVVSGYFRRWHFCDMPTRSKLQGKISQMAVSDERHLPANIVSYLSMQACGRDRRPGGAVPHCRDEFQFGSVCECRATDSQETSYLSPRSGYRFGSPSSQKAASERVPCYRPDLVTWT